MMARDALILGRVSNLPTLWSNVLAGAALSGAAIAPELPTPLLLAPMLLALSLMYIAGMYLNDAFDAAIDRRERPERPIPAGRVTVRAVFIAGFALLAAGLAMVIVLAGVTGRGAAPVVVAVVLAAAIVFYDVHHKANRFSPVVMGLCRALVYVTAALMLAPPQPALWPATVMLLSYLVGLTYAAREEHLGRLRHLWPLAFLSAPLLYALPAATESALAAVLLLLLAGWLALAVRRLLRRAAGDVPRAVAALLAAICLIDAIVIAGQGMPLLALAAAALFPLTLVAQRFIPAT
jgi:4-hydroxybenzoate polyprenyltransferase